MKKYAVEVWETTARTIYVEAKTAKEAHEKLRTPSVYPSGLRRWTVRSVRVAE